MLKANHNKDYSVVKTFSASPTCGAFLFHIIHNRLFCSIYYPCMEDISNRSPDTLIQALPNINQDLHYLIQWGV